VSATRANVQFDALDGETYLIEEAALVDDPLIDAAAVAIELPIDLTIDLPTTGRVLSDTGIGFNFGVVRFDITLECPTQRADAQIHLVLEQGSGSSNAIAHNSEDDNGYTCAPPSYTFDLFVPGDGPDPDAVFEPGPATMSFQYNAITAGQLYRSPTVRSTVQLTGGAAAPEVTVPPTSTIAPSAQVATGSSITALALVWLIGGLASFVALDRRRQPS
jgi:hypothetical protein